MTTYHRNTWNLIEFWAVANVTQGVRFASVGQYFDLALGVGAYMLHMLKIW
jgi:hypothetical protein